MPALAYVLIQVSHGMIDMVSKRLLKYKEVTDIHQLYGEFDIIITVESANSARLQDFIAKKLRPVRDIRATETLVASDVF
jgi:DNA-binding Lrp family transcriptional regulator